MKVAIVTRAFPALSETFVLDHVVGLIERGIEVGIFASGSRESALVHSEVLRYDLLDKTKFLHLEPNKLSRVRQALAILLQPAEVGDLTANLKLLNPIRYGKDALSLKLFFAYQRFADLGSCFDVVHCHFGNTGEEVLALRDAGLFKARLITTFHGADLSKLKHLRGGSPYRSLFARGDCFLAVSQFGQEKLISLGCDPRKLKVHHVGIDCDRIDFLNRSSLRPPPIRLLSVCRLVEKKGIDYAIRAVAKVKQSLPRLELQYVIIGDGPLSKDLRQLSQSLGVRESVEFTGSLDRERVAEHFARAHIYILPSHTSQDGDEEGIPVSIMEAMATGLPVISTFHSGISELVRDGVSGFLVPERDSDALAGRLQLLIDQPELWSSFGMAGRSHVEQHFNLRVQNDKLVEFYREVLANRGPGGAGQSRIR